MNYILNHYFIIFKTSRIKIQKSIKNNIYNSVSLFFFLKMVIYSFNLSFYRIFLAFYVYIIELF